MNHKTIMEKRHLQKSTNKKKNMESKMNSYQSGVERVYEAFLITALLKEIRDVLLTIGQYI